MNQKFIVYFIIVGAVGVVGLAWILLGAACSGSSVQITQETVGQCARGWIGAFSGWAAAIAAGATIFVIRQQILSQESENRRHEQEAMDLFDEGLLRHLNRVNRIWTQAENAMQQGEKWDAFQSHLKGRLTASSRDFDRSEIEEYLDLMPPKDRATRQRILARTREALKPVNKTYYDEPSDEVVDYEPNGEEYIEELMDAFDYLRFDLCESRPDFAQVFRRRTERVGGRREFEKTFDDVTFFSPIKSNPDNPL